MNDTTSALQQRLERKITGSISAIIEGKTDETESPLFAINWFDTRIAWVYHFYNWLASSRVFKIGGKVFFKGKNLQTISGNSSLVRDFLLIVNYPSGHAFLDLLSDRVFQVVSVLRAVAVKNFSFVLQKRIGEPQLLFDKIPKTEDFEKAHAVLHLAGVDGSKLEAVKTRLLQVSSANRCKLMFFGHEAGRVATANVTANANSTAEPNHLDYVTPMTAVFSATTQADLLNLFKSAAFQEFANQLDDHYVALLKRTM